MRTLCIWHLEYLQRFRNGCLFCTFWLIRNLNCAHSNHASYRERCSNHHFRHCAQCVSEIYSVLKLFENCCLFCIFWHIRNFYSGDTHHANYGKRSLDHHFQHCAHSLSQILRIFKVFKLTVFFAHFASGEISTPEMRNMLNMANSLNHHFLHCAHFLYEIYSFFKLFEMAFCFAHCGLFEISTPVMSNMLNMANIV